MLRQLFTLVMAAAALGPTTAPAQENPSAQSVVGRPLHFELPTLAGTRFVRASEFDGPVLLNFWGRDCPPCVAELPLVQSFARDNPDWTVLLVATDSPQDAARFLASRRIDLPTLRGGPNVASLMRSAGNRQGALPFTVTLHRARICASHTGLMQEESLAALVKGCAP